MSEKSVKNANKGKNKKQNSNGEPIVMDFGSRKISNQNFSKMMAIPKPALSNLCQEEVEEVNVQLVQQNGERYLKLTPICSTKQTEVKK